MMRVKGMLALALTMGIMMVGGGISFPQGSLSALADAGEYGADTVSEIPEQAIRLRIIANSDAPQDQQLKRDVRDRVIEEVGKKLYAVQTEEEARQILKKDLPEIDRIAKEVVREKGSHDPVKTEYGIVPFPTKIYGDKVYPAGNYEALRIVIGKGEGQNWWCVLFPALCFVDIAHGDAVQVKAKDMSPTAKPLSTIEVAGRDPGQKEKVQVRSALLDGIVSLLAKISQWIHKWLPAKG
jgi:stage II sporulation protein R